ncbi:MAG: type II secretion system protein GspL [Caulobacter sp.]|nr:type II secretion system protein GspL [Caulobacter sp.]
MNSLKLFFPSPTEGGADELLEGDGLGPRRRTLAPGERVDDEAIVVLPGVDVGARRMELPLGSLAQARSAAAFRLQDELALDEGELHVAVGAIDEQGQALIGWIRSARLQQALDVAESRGVRPAAALPDYFLLPEDETPTMAAFGPRLAVRGRDIAFSAEPELAAVLLGDRPHRYINAGDLDALLLRQAPKAPIDLLQGRFAEGVSEPGRVTRHPFLLAAALVLSPLIILGAESAQRHVLAARLEEEVRASAVALVPSSARYEDAAGFALAELSKRRDGGFARLVTAYLGVVRSVPGVSLDTLVYGANGDLRSAVSYGAYSDMDQLRKAAARAGLSLVEQSTITEGSRTTSDLIIRSAP